MKRRTKILAALLCGFVIGMLLLAYWYETRAYRKWFMFAIYGNAWAAFGYDHGCTPSTLEEMEQSYNRSDLRRFEFPVDSTQARPIFRTCKNLGHGPYVVLIESAPREWYLKLWRYVIVACGDEPETEAHPHEIRSVWTWQLDDLIREDDLKRQRAEQQKVGQ